MKLESQVCSLNLAKKLKELGVAQHDAQFYWEKIQKPDWVLSHRELLMEQVHYSDGMWPLLNEALSRGDAFAALTVAELGQMLPKFISLRSDQGSNRYLIISNGAAPFNDVSKWYVYYDKIDEKSDYLVGAEDVNEANARAAMLVYLLKNNLLKVAQINQPES